MHRPTVRLLSRMLLCIVASLPAMLYAYVPVRCTARQTYSGRPQHAPLIALPTPGDLSENPFGLATTQRLDQAFERILTATGAPAISAAVAVPGIGLWTHTIAPADAPLLYWASAGKTFTAVVVLQLAEEGRLSLDDTVSLWVPRVPHGELITVRDLLAHTSGLFSANEDAVVHANPHYLDLEESLAIVRRHGAMFCPGANWRYSNTGYGLLGEIVRQVDGRPIDAAISARIIDRLGLTATRALRPNGGATGVAPLVSATEQTNDPSWAGAAGPIAASATDMVRFWAALLNGQLLRPDTVGNLSTTLYPMFDPGTFYGLGVMAYDIPSGDQRNLWLGHGGGQPGAKALVIYSPADHAFIAVALTGDGPASAAAALLLTTWRENTIHGRNLILPLPSRGSPQREPWSPTSWTQPTRAGQTAVGIENN